MTEKHVSQSDDQKRADHPEGNTLLMDQSGLNLRITVDDHVFPNIGNKCLVISETHTFQSPQPSNCVKLIITAKLDGSNVVVSWPTKFGPHHKTFDKMLPAFGFAEDKFISLLSAHISQMNAPFVKDNWNSTCWLVARQWSQIHHFLKNQLHGLKLVPETEYKDRTINRDKAAIYTHLTFARAIAERMGMDTTLYDKLIEEVKPQRQEGSE